MSSIKYITGILLALSLLAWSACTGTKSEPLSSNNQKLNLAIWGNYLAPEIQAQFEKETGIQLHLSNYSSNEELLAKIQSGASGLDVAVPSDYMVEIMIKTGLLEPLKMNLIPHKDLISESLLKLSYDSENKYSLPYAWSTAGLVINTELYTKPITNWKQFFNNPDLKGKISMLDDSREVIGAALKMNGFSVNSIKPEELAKAKATLMSAKPRIKMFRSDTIEALINKEVAIAHAFSVDALQAMAKNPKLVYLIPEEGGTRAIDNLVILKGAKNISAAHLLIDFLLRPESNIAFVTKVRGGPVLKATQEQLPVELRNNKALFPEENQLAKLERIQDLGDQTRLYDQLWTELKSQ